MSLADSPRVIHPIPAALAVVAREGRVLLVRRIKPPDQGLWGVPGGRIEPGETVFAAAVRELWEETRVEAAAERVLTAIDVIGRCENGLLEHHFVLIAVLCRWVAGDARAADDVSDARWFTLGEIERLRGEGSEHVAAIARLAFAAGREA